MKLQLGPEKVSPGLHVPTRVVVVPPRLGNAALLNLKTLYRRERNSSEQRKHTKKYNIIQNKTKCKQRTSYIKKAKSSINTGRNILKKRGSSLDRFPTLPEGFRGLIQKIRSKLCLNKMCRVSGILYFLDQSQKQFRAFIGNLQSERSADRNVRVGLQRDVIAGRDICRAGG